MSGISPPTYSFSDEEQTLPRGDYLVIDPCYIVGEDPFWGDQCDYQFEGSRRVKDGFFVNMNGHLAFFFGTAYGDGVYPADDGHTYGDCGVDAGMLSLIPMAFVTSCTDGKYGGGDRNITDLGVVLTLERDAVPEYDEGDVTVGNISIQTGGLGEEEEESSEDEDDSFEDEDGDEDDEEEYR